MKIYDVDARLLQTHPEVIEDMKQRALNFARNFKDSPENMTDWGHNYHCPFDGEQLTFDLNRPHEHECRICHRVHKSQILDNVWTYMYRFEVILTVLNLAVLYELEKDPEYIELYKKLLTFYAENYDKFVLHWKRVITENPQVEPIVDAGKIMPQGLNEAMIINRIVISLEILKDYLDKDFTDLISEKLLIPAVTGVTIPEITQIHNKGCWYNSAVAIVGFYTGREDLVDFAYNGKLGLNQQIIQGVTKDNIWYEGSIYYTYFALESLVQLLAFSRMYDRPIECEKIIADMLVEGYYFAFENDTLPNPNDGWPNLNLKTFDFTYALATKVFGEDSEVGNVYKNICANPVIRGPLPLSETYYYKNNLSFDHLVTVPYIDISNRKPIKRTSKNYTSTYFVKLNNENINTFLKYGHVSKSHFHPDKMNIEIMIKGKSLSRDLSNTGYITDFCTEWYRRSVSHNTVVADGIDHLSIVPGILVEYTDTSCITEAKEAYEGIDYRRSLAITDDNVCDVFEVTSKDEHNYDFLFHCEAKLISELDFTEGDIVYNENGYQNLNNLRKVNYVGDSITLRWLLDDVEIESVIDVAGKEFFIADTFDNPPHKIRTSLILRQKAENAKFTINWNIK
ncbi:MAG: heparinase II/III family protein [Clostridia bacterium]